VRPRDSFGPSLSGDGRRVAFLSGATNLPAVPPRTPGTHVFVRDLAARSTVAVDVDRAGRPGRGTAWGAPAISRDGRFVAFTSDAPLVPGDTDHRADVFVRDLEARRTTSVSVGPRAPSGFDFAAAGGISRDGRFVVFLSDLPLGPGAKAGHSAVFVWDRLTNTTTWIGPADGDHATGSRPVISDDGRVVAFEQRSPLFGVVVWDATVGATTCVACWDGMPPATVDTLSGMSADGRRIAFVRTDTSSPGVGAAGVFVHDRATLVTERVSVGFGGAPAAGTSWLGGLSPDGRFAAFSSGAADLVPGDTNRRTDLFVRGPL
jgi:Tol biopolymer transport system component